MKIKFTNVGRGKANWLEEIDTSQPEEQVCGEIAKSINKNGGLISNNVEIDYTENWNGRIYAGFHKVGTFGPEQEAA